MMKLLGRVRRAALLITAVLLGSGGVSASQDGVGYSYVANTAPPDAFLALHTDPTSNSPRIMAMANGTKLEVLNRRVDGWWLVRVSPTGEQGWAFSGHGNKAWILCCVAGNETKPDGKSVADRQDMSDPPTGPPPDVYTPTLGSQERASIMDAIRLATHWTVKFKVDHLVVARQGSKAVAVADVSDASAQLDASGIFEIEGLNGQWRVLYTVGGGGGTDPCTRERVITTEMLDKAKEYSAPRELFSAYFWKLKADNGSPGSDDGDCPLSRSFVESNR
jgi:hypothetical protein